MSPVPIPSIARDTCFPRVSGDEPADRSKIHRFV